MDTALTYLSLMMDGYICKQSIHNATTRFGEQKLDETTMPVDLSPSLILEIARIHQKLLERPHSNCNGSIKMRIELHGQKEYCTKIELCILLLSDALSHTTNCAAAPPQQDFLTQPTNRVTSLCIRKIFTKHIDRMGTHCTLAKTAATLTERASCIR